MEGLQNRLDSFLKAKRVKNPNKASYVNIKWPHPESFAATPETLAEAGFYFNPSYEDRDTVTCYVCEKNLGGWEEEDDPLDLHWTKCATLCCWATVRCGLRGDMGKDGSYLFPDKDRLPTSAAMERARLETYSVGKGWVHDRPKNHGANSLKMARSGFVFTPQEPGDDLATCLYCGVCLSGWDPEDDPLEEHRKRDQKGKLRCPFFAYTESVPSKPPSKSKAPRSRQSSRQRTTSSQHQGLVVPLKDDTDNESVASTSKPKGTRSRSSSRKLNRSQSRATLGDVAEDMEEAIVEEEDEEVKPKKKVGKTRKSVAATKARARTKAAAVPTEEDDVEVDEPSPVEPTPPDSQEVDEVQSLKKSTRGRRVTRASSIEVSKPATTTKQKATRGKKKHPTPAAESDPEPTQDVAEEEDEEEDEEEPPKPAKAKASTKAPTKTPRKPSRSKTKPTAAPPEESEIAEEDDEELAAEAAAVEAIVLPSEPVGRRQSAAPTIQPTEPPKKGSKSKPKAKLARNSPSPSGNERGDKGPPKAAPASKAKAEALPPPPIEVKPTDEDAGMDDLPPLYIPKRGGKAKAGPSTPLTSEAATEKPTKPSKSRVPSKDAQLLTATNREAVKEVPKMAKNASVLSLASVAQSEVSDMADSDASEVRKPLVKRLSKAPRKPSTTRPRTVKQKSVVEISSDDDSDKEKKSKSKERKEPVPSEAAKQKSAKHDTQPKVVKPEPEPMQIDSPPPKQSTIVAAAEMDISSPPRQPHKSVESRSRSPDQPPSPIQDRVPSHTRPSPPPPARAPSPLQPSRALTPSPVQDLPKKAAAESLSVKIPKAGTVRQQPSPHVEDVKMTSPNGLTEKPTTPVEPPRTPPRQTAFTTNTVQPKPAEPDPAFYPPLSRLPFTKMASLTGAELDMTVEEWIRYQMELEYDKFRRDGERELVRFKKAAEDVRRIIEDL